MTTICFRAATRPRRPHGELHLHDRRRQPHDIRLQENRAEIWLKISFWMIHGLLLYVAMKGPILKGLETSDR